ncbi:hypothetical protein [Nocardia thraciensis]
MFAPLRTVAARTLSVAGLLISAGALSGCGTDGPVSDHESDYAAIGDPIAVTSDGGIYLLDGESLALADEVKLEGFDRLFQVGDGHHLMVSTRDGFRVLDAVHGELAEIAFPAAEPGEAVSHAGRVALFADGSGEVTIFDSARLADGPPRTEVYRTAAGHQGVAVPLSTGGLVVTLGAGAHRTGIAVLDADRGEIARNEDCPGVRGAATVRGEAVVLGCDNGALIYRDGVITKVTAPAPVGRIGALVGTDASPIALGDYRRGAETERPQQVALIDTRDGSLRPVELGTGYTYRSLARGPRGEGLVLGADGRIHVIDPVAGAVVGSIAVIEPWEQPRRQQPRPALFVRGTDAYVCDSTTRRVIRVDLVARTVEAAATLPGIPNELVGTAGR